MAIPTPSGAAAMRSPTVDSHNRAVHERRGSEVPRDGIHTRVTTKPDPEARERSARAAYELVHHEGEERDDRQPERRAHLTKERQDACR